MWAIGKLARTAWLDEGVENNPRAAGAASSSYYIYDHETGNDADGSPMTEVYIESADFDIGEGDKIAEGGNNKNRILMVHLILTRGGGGGSRG